MNKPLILNAQEITLSDGFCEATSQKWKQINDTYNIYIADQFAEDITALDKIKNEKELDKTIAKDESIDFNDRFDPIEKLSGIITDISESTRTFTASMRNEKDGAKIIATISFSDIEKSEISEIKIGRKFLYLYGRQYVRGTCFNSTKIIFRAMEFWNPQKIKSFNSKVDSYIKLFD